MSKLLSFLAAGALLFALGACNTNPDSNPNPNPAPAVAGDDSLTIVEPASGATVSSPFKVRVKTTDPLGTTESGNHHIHIWFDGNEAKYQISYGDTAEVKDIPDGAHKMTVSLRNANHSDAGPRVEIPITVGGASGQTGDTRVPTY